MKLYLIRHGDAEPMLNDAVRPLTERGRQEAERVGRYLKKIDAPLDFIFHSTLKRSWETASIAAHIMGMSDLLEERQGLRPEDDPERFAEALSDESRNGAIVGHLPFLHILASHLLCGISHTLSIKYTTGSILYLNREGYGNWTLRSFTPAKVLTKFF